MERSSSLYPPRFFPPPRRALRSFFLLPLSLLLLACPPPPVAAPASIDELAHWSFTTYEPGDPTSDSLRAEAMDNLLAWQEQHVETGEEGGSLSDLTEEEISSLSSLQGHPDPGEAVGVYIARQLPCTLEQVSAILLEPHQDEQYPGNYTSYQREFLSDSQCFLNESCDFVDWVASVEDSVSLASFTYQMHSGVRRWVFPRGEGEEGPTTAVASQTYMPAAAVSSAPDVGGFEQTYQVEVFVPDGEEMVVHLYGFWNEAYLNLGDADEGWWANQYLDSLRDWDDRTAELCQGE